MSDAYLYIYVHKWKKYIYLFIIYLFINIYRQVGWYVYLQTSWIMYIYKQVGWWQDGMVYCVDLQLDQLTRVCACLHDDHFANML